MPPENPKTRERGQLRLLTRGSIGNGKSALIARTALKTAGIWG
jgi:sulfate adenylyltransferase subunit 1 (EFTu-like GTPase family)